MSAKRNPIDWTLFVVLTFMWGVAYPFTRLAVHPSDPAHGLPPQVVIAARLTLGAVILLSAALITRQTFPPLRDLRRWSIMAGMGFVGMVAPFLLITTAQKTVDSSLAALYTAAAPLFVALLAHFFFQDEKMTWKLAGGLVVGFSGIGILFGPDAIASFGSASVIAQAFCLIGTFFYALATIIARGSPSMSPLAFTAGYVTLAAIMSWPGLLTVDLSQLDPAPSAIYGVIGLGVIPTAAASLLYTQLVRRTSATFLSLTGYSIPVISAIIGFFAFGEIQPWYAFLAFGLILAGVWIAQHAGKPVHPQPIAPPK